VAGRRLAVLGDTSDSSELVKLVGAGGLEVLVHEATMENRLQEKAISFGHSTPSMAAGVAERCGARHLVITHLSPRYKPVSACGPDGESDSAMVIVQEAREELDRLGREDMELTVAEDFTEVTIPKRTVKNMSIEK
jgi:ribonuclease BN (tRNA processing enzyme)